MIITKETDYALRILRVLLDEITANLDAETEARVLEALRRASVGRTVLSVSHRIYENLGGRTVEIRTQGLE